jgi:hypothetical protein
VLLAAVIGCGGGGAKPASPIAPAPVVAIEDASSAEPIADDAAPSPIEEGAGAVQASLPPLPPAAPEDAGAAPARPTDGEEGARALLERFVAPNADHAALTRALRPAKADYRALFDARTAAKVEAAQSKDWGSNKAVIKPKPGQTEVKLWSATGADLARGDGNAREFPAGYAKLAKHLVPTAVYFRFKFVERGKETGTAYDGLAFVNDHWVIVPKPWRALEPSRGGDDAASERPVKKKPKKTR